MENLVLSTNSWDEETFIYLTREYKNNLCLNEFEIGIGKADDPLRRWKEHNSASSKSTVKIAFEYIYLVKTKEYERQLHKRLISMGFTNLEKEVFSGTNNYGQTLTIEFLNDILEKEALDGPWAIIDGKITTTKNYQEIKNKKEIEAAQKLFIQTNQYNPGLFNQLKIALDKKLVSYNQLATQYKNEQKIIFHTIKNNLITFEDIPENLKFELNTLMELYKHNIIEFEYIKNNINNIFDSTNKLSQENIQAYIDEVHDKIEKRKQEIEKRRIHDEQLIEKRNLINNIQNDIRHNKIKILNDIDIYRENPKIIDFALANNYLSIFEININLLRHYISNNRTNLKLDLNFLIKDDKYVVDNFLNRSLVEKIINKNNMKASLLLINIILLIMGPAIFISIIQYHHLKIPNEYAFFTPIINILLFPFLLNDPKITAIERYLNKELTIQYFSKNQNDSYNNNLNSQKIDELNQALKGHWNIKEYESNESIRSKYNFKKDF